VIVQSYRPIQQQKQMHFNAMSERVERCTVNQLQSNVHMMANNNC